MGSKPTPVLSSPRSVARANTGLPDWMHPPRPEGWFAEDLDHLPHAPAGTELIDGILVFRLFPQTHWHSRTVQALRVALDLHAPTDIEVNSRLTIRLDARNRPEPDVIASTVSIPPDATWYEAKDIVLAIEVVSPESKHRDKAVKPHKYAEAGIGHFWRVEDEDGNASTVVHVYELDDVTKTYVPIGIFRDTLKVDLPFPVELDVQALYG
jgi:Uma2 family endonuclease